MNPPEPVAFTFQLSPEPPPVAASALPPGVADDAMDAAWFAVPDAAKDEAPVDELPSDALADALTEAATQTPPPARALPLPVRNVPRPAPEPIAEPAPLQGRAPTLPRPITIDAPLTDPPMLVTPTSGHQISQLLTAPSDEPAPVVREPEPVRVSDRLPKTKPLAFPSDIKQMEPQRSPAPVLESPAAPAAASEPGPAPEPPRAAARREPTPAPERVSGAVAAEAPREPAAAVKDTSTFKVIGYALVAMAFSYIGMSALVAWLSDAKTDPAATAPIATTAQAAHTDVEGSAEAADEAATETAAPAAAPPSPAEGDAEPSAHPAPAAKGEPAAKEQVAIEDLPVPAGLALGADKGVLKLVTPDAHSLYVDGEFAGRGPVRIVPLPPGKHMIKTRFDGEEKSYEANVQAGRMTRLTISAAK